jgi:hypothetical protein
LILFYDTTRDRIKISLERTQASGYMLEKGRRFDF